MFENKDRMSQKKASKVCKLLLQILIFAFFCRWFNGLSRFQELIEKRRRMMREFLDYRDRRKREYEENEDKRRELRKGTLKNTK